MTDNQKIEKYKKELETERAKILGEIKTEGETEDFGSDVDHFDEEADEAESLGTRLAIIQDLKNRLEDINVALDKMQRGKYGVCEKCGVEIENGVLAIAPESRFCRHCKQKKINFIHA